MALPLIVGAVRHVQATKLRNSPVTHPNTRNYEIGPTQPEEPLRKLRMQFDASLSNLEVFVGAYCLSRAESRGEEPKGNTPLHFTIASTGFLRLGSGTGKPCSTSRFFPPLPDWLPASAVPSSVGLRGGLRPTTSFLTSPLRLSKLHGTSQRALPSSELSPSPNNPEIEDRPGNALRARRAAHRQNSAAKGRVRKSPSLVELAQG